MLTPSRLKLIVVIVVLFGVVSLAGLVSLIVIWQKKLSPFQDFALVIDAGSSRSTIFLYQWPADKSDGLGTTSRVNQSGVCKVDKPSLTSIKDPTIDNVREYFQEAMSKCINQIPENRKSRAMIFLGGTAGLRLSEMTDSNYTDRLLISTRAYFETLGLYFRAPEDQVRIISGSEEGLSGWITTNILMGQLFHKNDPFQTYGVSDMGGASTQLSFISPEATHDKFLMSLFNTNYDVYSHSYICYGGDQMRLVFLGQLVDKANESLTIDNPCLQNGSIQNYTADQLFSTPCYPNRYAALAYMNASSNYSFVGTGNPDECRTAVIEHFNTTVCESGSCSFDNVYQPKPIPSSLRFIGIAGWYNTFQTLAANTSVSKDASGNYNFRGVTLEKISTAIDAICRQPWSEIRKPDVFRPWLCLNSMYHWTLLEHGYGMNDTNLENFQIVKIINGNEIGWTLGYMINQTNALTADKRPARLLRQSEFIGLLILCAFVLVLSSIIAILVLRKIRTNRYYLKN